MLSIALNVSLGFGMYLLLQGPLLRSSGQTWGKRIFGIYIVDMSSRKPEFWKLAFVRELPFELIYLIHLVGQLLGLVNILMIARMDHRCGHDLLAGTQVVRFLEDASAEHGTAAIPASPGRLPHAFPVEWPAHPTAPGPARETDA
jgi:uncharacterized RDD family membrane protein YckC